MTDHRLQTLRRTQAPGDLAFQSRLLTARMRAGELAPARVRLAAWLGDEAAQGVGFPAATLDQRHWWAPFDTPAILESTLAVVEWVQLHQLSNFGFARVTIWLAWVLRGDPTAPRPLACPRSQAEALSWLREGLREVPNGWRRAREVIAGAVIPWALGVRASRLEAAASQRAAVTASSPPSGPAPEAWVRVSLSIPAPVRASFLRALRRAFPQRYAMVPLARLKAELTDTSVLELGAMSEWAGRLLRDRATSEGLGAVVRVSSSDDEDRRA